MSITTILFDLDDTLVLEVPSARRAMGETSKRFCRQRELEPEIFIDTLLQEARKLWYASPMHPYAKKIAVSSWEGLWSPFGGDHPQLRRLREWAPTYRHQAWYQTLLSFGVDDKCLAADMAERFPLLRRQQNVLFEDTLPCLEWAQKEYDLALLSNGASDLQRVKLDGAGLTDWFSYVLISGDIEIRKPDPAYFNVALDCLGIQAAEVVMVGNSLVSDVAGARAAGIYSIWLDRSGFDADGDVAPDARIVSLAELPACIAQLD